MASGASWNSIAFGNNTFVAVGGWPGRACNITYNGYEWINGAALPASTYWSGIGFGNYNNGFTNIPYFITVSWADVQTAITSNGGLTWTAGGSLPATQYWTGVTFGNTSANIGTWVAVAGGSNSNTGAYSTNNGATWTSMTLPLTNYWWSVSFGNGYFMTLAGGQNGSANNYSAYSANGYTWTQGSITTNAIWTGTAFANNNFVGVGYNSTSSATNITPLPLPIAFGIYEGPAAIY